MDALRDDYPNTAGRLPQAELAFQILDAVEQAVIVTDPDGCIRYWNPYAEQLYGWAVADVLGRNIVEVTPAVLSREQAAALMAQLQRGEKWSGTFQVQRRDSTVFWAQVTDVPLHDARGQLTGILGLSTDVTERLRAAETEHWLAAIVAAANETIISFTVDGMILSWNAAAERMFGYTATEAIGRSVALLLPSDGGDGQEVLAALIAQAGAAPIETMWYTKLGVGLVVLLTLSVMPHGGGPARGVTATIHDITARKQAETEREQLLRTAEAARADAEAALAVRDQFLAMAAHELKTPLTSVLGYARLLETQMARGTADAQKTVQMAAQIARHAERLDALVEQHLDVVHLQGGHFTLHLQPLDLRLVVDAVVADTRATLSPLTHLLVVTQPEQAVVVQGDPLRLDQVAQNLLTNAVKYSPAGGTIRIEVTVHAGDAVLVVTDPGIGVPLEAQAHIFEPFYRARNVGPGSSGFGIGLYVAHEIVQRHGGRITVRSSPGAGSRFEVRLPLLGAG